MINLIKNELYKIFHKKAIYILAIITLAFALLNIVIVHTVDNNTLESSSEKFYYTMIEQSIDSYDLSNAEESDWYVSEKTELDVYKEARKYDYDSWQKKLITNKGYDMVYCRNEAEYISKDLDKKVECEKNFNDLLTEVENNDWQYFIKKDIAEKEQELTEFKTAISLLENESDKISAEKTIKRLEYELEGLNYRLANNIPDTIGAKSSMVDEYVASATAYLEYNKDDDVYKTRDELIAKRSTEAAYYINKYKMDHNLLTDKKLPANEAVVSDLSAPVGFVIIVIIMIAGSIVAEECNKGTIKQLLLKPYSRSKILASKYIASLIIFVIFLAYFTLVTAFTYGISSGFDTLFTPYVVYSFNTHTAYATNVLAMVGIQTLAVLPEYLILLTLAFFMSTATGSSALSITIPLLVYFFSSLINAMIISFKVKALSFFPTMCWDFSEYLFGGIPSFEYSNMTISIIVITVIFLALLSLSFIIFKKKNIKNQ